MPYPTQVTQEKIIETAWALVEAEGIDQLSLGRLAAALGIKAPSLYNHFTSKADLLKAVNEHTEALLFEAIGAALAGARPDAGDRLRATARVYRAFALAHPVTYVIAFTTQDEAARPNAAAQEQHALILQEVVAELTGPEDSLAALRGLWALIHGFVLLEIHGQFRRGGSTDAAYMQAVESLLVAWR